MKMEKHRVAQGKLAYVKGTQRPDVPCILCCVAEGDPRVEDLTVYRRGAVLVTLNLYPFNPGHVMVVPLRHVEDYRDLTPPEAMEMHHMQRLTLNVLEKVYQPGGFNVGYNLGRSSGASIAHLHLQVVPRYATELGFYDIFSDSRALVESPRESMSKLKGAFAAAAPGFFDREG
ncbi:MAG: HIT domain-containing protein [Deltaproteobacteria bacterium]|nr:HIT domain-containing protein [Deltaproteobacteria bacterium]